MKIALDPMGGDFGPPNLVSGAVMALKAYPQITKLLLVGDPAQIEAELKAWREDYTLSDLRRTGLLDPPNTAYGTDE